VEKDYYSILEVWPTASAEEIKTSYFKLAKLYHPDVAGNTKENHERFKLINEAFRVLSDPQKRQQYDEMLRKSRSGSKSAHALQTSDKRSASLAFTQAREAIKNGRYDKAVILLKSALKYDPDNPAYHSWYGFCLAMLNTRLHEARDECRKAVEMEFYNADYHANLGFVYFKVGLKKVAMKHFKEALKWDPENHLAKKFISLFGEEPEEAEEVGPIDKAVGFFKTVFSKVF